MDYDVLIAPQIEMGEPGPSQIRTRNITATDVNVSSPVFVF
jgi:hypothetical protein